MVKSVIIRVVVVLVGILAVVFGRGFFYYDGFYQAPPIEIPSYTQIAVPLAPKDQILGYGVGMRKNDDIINTKIRDIVKKLKSEGYFRWLERKWLKTTNESIL